MTSTELENFARLGKLKREGATQTEFDGLVRSGRIQLGGAQDPDLAPVSRFDLGLGPEVWRVLDKAHSLRNMSEYEGYAEIDERLLEDLVRAARRLEAAICDLGPIQPAMG